jgi:dienelactone hydrolase
MRKAKSMKLRFFLAVAFAWSAGAQAKEPFNINGALPKAVQKAAQVSWEGEKIDQWRGYTRHNFVVDGCNAWVVEPKQARPGNPWTWCMEFPDAFTDRTGVPQLLEKGFYNVHIAVGNTFGCPDALKHFDAMYASITAQGLAKKGTLIGISRGGLYAYNWASRNPDKVNCIYGDAPVCDFKSWPGGKGKGKGSADDWKALIKSYHFKDETAALAWTNNPVDRLEPIAKAKIPLVHVVGDVDDIVPVDENTAIIEHRYKALGGEITVFHKPAVGHHPHGLDDTRELVGLILRYTENSMTDK